MQFLTKESKLNLDLSRDHTFSKGIYDFMAGVETIKSGNSEGNIELDYTWDYESDPVITPTIIHEWKYLDQLVSTHVFKSAKSTLSLGGGGSSRTHEYLSPGTQEFAILNTGKWDLENAHLPSAEVVSLLVRATGENMPFLDQSFDAIEIPATLDHVVDAKKVLEECFRILKDGGKIGITLGNSRSWYRRLIEFMRIRIADNHEHHHNFHFTANDVENILAAAGFVKINTVGTAYLKLPKALERKINSSVALSTHRFISNTVLRLVFGKTNGGMFLVFASKPKTL